MALPNISDLNPLKPKKTLQHIAINGKEVNNWSEDENATEKTTEKNIEQIDRFIDYQIKTNLKVLTLNISTETVEQIKSLTTFFEKLITDERIKKNNIRVFIIGRWFDLETDLIENFKRIMDDTKENEKQYLNFCVKYDGQEEVLGVIKLLTRKAMAGKIDLDKLEKNNVKENLYTSYFPPPNLIIENTKKYSGLLLWDSKEAVIYYTHKHWLELKTEDITKAIEFYNKEN
ncbi:MAG: undecaprenyl diphosphate synthase family protein [Nanoarchaeota archaeon]|nr:undecaprenyl diphosphate synthase family protein [Nanoarchaeota archaeon]MBU1029820.1 undecaprenyl diphosphate synthase family protein [Nanoarchaeota archaeon]MBU1849653.1 undecaprenyl diphosphate synthase family protein [Nanoarchaeota archaeon]